MLFLALLLALAGCGGGGSSAGTRPGTGPGGDPQGQARCIAHQVDGAVHLVRTDGGGDHVLIADWASGEQLHPDWAPDAAVAFSADGAGGRRDIWVAAADGSGARRIVRCRAACRAVDDPARSPEGRSIAFTRIAAGAGDRGIGTLEILRLGDRAARVVATAGPAGYFFVPRWSPDGSRLVVEIDRFATRDVDEETVTASFLARVDLGGGRAAPERITGRSLTATTPDWSPAGDRIVFAAAPGAPGGASDLRTMRPDGGDLTTITSLSGTGLQAIQPSWSPDGDRILFVWDRLGTDPVLAAVAAEGGEPVSATGAAFLPGTHPRLQP